DNYDHAFDGLKMQNEGVFNLATITRDGFVAAINNVSDAFCSKTIGISLLNVKPGSYTLEFESVQSLHGVGSATLIDRYENGSVDLMRAPYTFEVTADTASFGKHRFELIFERPALDLNITPVAAAACSEDAMITLPKTQRGAMYRVLTTDHQQVGEALMADGG